MVVALGDKRHVAAECKTLKIAEHESPLPVLAMEDGFPQEVANRQGEPKQNNFRIHFAYLQQVRWKCHN